MIIIDNKRLHLNICTIGHLGHGKTTLTLAIHTILAKKKKTKIKNNQDISINIKNIIQNTNSYINHFQYETQIRHYSHLDYPGHLNYINRLMTGLFQMDAAILVISILDGLKAQTKEHILLAKLLGISSLLIFLNKEDELDDPEMLPLLIQEIRQLLIYYGFPGDTIPIISGSALAALEQCNCESNCIQGQNKWIDKIYYLIDHLDLYLPIPRRQINKPFMMAIEKVFFVPNYGYLATGIIQKGKITVGTPVEIVGFKKNINSNVISIKMFNKFLYEAIAGDDIGIVLQNINKNDLKKGIVIAEPNTIKSFYKFNAKIYLLNREEGGRHSPFFEGYCPQFYFSTVNITGKMESLLDEKNEKTWMVMPGEKIKAKIQLIYSIALKKKMRFIIREGGFIVGIGIIIELTK